MLAARRSGSLQRDHLDERHMPLLMDLHSFHHFNNKDTPLVLSRANSLSSSIDKVAGAAAAAAAVAATAHHRRRSSASQIIPIVSTSTPPFSSGSGSTSKRTPLAPLDPQFSLTTNKDIDMAQDDAYHQSGRKSSITLTNATRPTPYVQRNLPRRYTPNQRRTSLPALHPTHDTPPPPPPVPALPPTATNPVSPHELANTHDDDADIYSRLSTFTFGDVRSPTIPTASSSASRSDDAEGVSPLDKTPRPSVAHAHIAGHNSHPVKQSAQPNGWSSPSEDEEDRKRTSTRSKMRAIDDGTRRPSLPSNDVQKQQQQPHSLSSSGMSTDKGKGRAYPLTEGDKDGNWEGMKGRRGTVMGSSTGTGSGPTSKPVSPISPTEGEGEAGLELDTDVDLMMSADDTDRRRRAGGAGGGRNQYPYHGMSDRSSVHMSSDAGSVYGDVEADERNRRARRMQSRETDVNEGERMGVDVGVGEGSGAADAARKDSARTWTQETFTGRRGSLPMDIPYPASSNSSSRYTHSQQHSYREESTFDAHARAQAQLRRGSRSVDDDLQRAALHLQRKASRVSVAASAVAAGSGHHGLESAGSGPSSEPDMRGVAMAQAIAQAHLDAQAQAQAQAQSQTQNQSDSGINLNIHADPGGSSSTNDEPYQGLDLNYILSVTGGGGGSLGSGEKRGSDAWSVGKLSVGSSVVAAGRERDPSWAAGWGIDYSRSVGRRQSTATVNDDTFLRFVKKHDYTYDERKREWTFARERTEPDPGHTPRPGQEIWRCLWVGRYKVDRVNSKNGDPSKPLQIRLNIRHLPDPYTKASTRGGPLTFIHKHSRAQAFSIFRGHTLPQRHLKTSSSILLAPKKVQEQFTSTRTTSKLSTHGLLDDSRGEAGTTGTGTGTGSATTSATSTKDRDRDRDRRDRDREREQTASGSGTNSATTSVTSVSGSSHAAPSGHSTSATSTGSKTLIGSASSDQPHQHQHQQRAGKLRLRIDKKESIESTSSAATDKKGKSVLRSPVDSGGGPPSSIQGQSQTSMAELSAAPRSASVSVSPSSPDRDKGSSDANTPVSRTSASARHAFENTQSKRSMDVDTEHSHQFGHGHGHGFGFGGGASRPVSSIAETASLASEGSNVFSSAVSAWDGLSIGSSQRQSVRHSQDLRRQVANTKVQVDARGSIGSLDEQPVRTSHAEAFATLEPPFIEYLRMNSEKYDGSSDHDSQPSRFRGLRKLFHPQPLKSGSAKHAHGPPTPGGANVAVLEGHYTPPWLTMAARSKQEEQERVIKNLNDSFRDVGLLPSFKPSKNKQNKKGRRSSDNVFDQIPDESVYMLLPMWPGETDPTSAALEDEPMELNIPLHERQYLLVYYVPNELSKDKERKPEGDKKRTRGSSHQSSAASHHSEASTARGADGKPTSSSSSNNKNAIQLSSFNVLARLVSYKDVNGSGIRVPTNGLAVTGSMRDAIAAIPQVRFQVDDLALMIAFCASRERGVEVVPEGAEKLGLCVPRTGADDPDADAPLSPLGRAAVEMAWLGALAVMGFGNVGNGGGGGMQVT